jgi:hypothetical protein
MRRSENGNAAFHGGEVRRYAFVMALNTLPWKAALPAWISRCRVKTRNSLPTTRAS